MKADMFFKYLFLLCKISKIFVTFCTECISCKMLPTQSKVGDKSGSRLKRTAVEEVAKYL